jgi:hypothetical protein
MAPSGERRLLFDTRGRRKHVIRVVYAILALLMGASLFLVVGPVNIGALIGNSTGTSSAATALQEQAERIEKRLAKNPDDEQLLVALTRARIGAGNAQLEGALESETPTLPTGAHEDYEVALRAWNRYLKQAGKEPNPSAAQLVAVTYFTLAEKGSASIEEIQSNISTAAKAQQIVVEKLPSAGSFSQLAIDRYFEGDFAAGDKATKQAAAKAGTKTEVKGIEEQLAAYRKRAKQFQKSIVQAEKQAKKAGREQLQSPLGLGGSTGSGLGGE